jgi:hypothetical protein
MAGGVSQSVGPEFKPQYYKKKIFLEYKPGQKYSELFHE